MQRFRRKVLAGLILLWLAPVLSAASARFIILIDPSPKMDARREAIMRTVGDLVRTGFHERIQDGDTLTIHAGGFGAPLLEGKWSADAALDWRDKAIAVAGALPYRSASGQSGGMRVQSTEENVSLFILTDGFHRLGGTGFDEEINAALESARDVFETAAKPMLVTILADQGQWVTWSAHTTLGAPIVLPELPPRKVARKEKEIPPPVIVPAEPKREPEPEPAPPIVAKVEPPIPEPVAIKEGAREPAPKVEIETPKLAPPEQEVVVAQTAPILTETKPDPPPVLAAVVPPPAIAPKRPGFPWLLLSFALAIVAFAGAAVYKRLTRPAPVANSLISRSIEGRSAPRSKFVAERKGD